MVLLFELGGGTRWRIIRMMNCQKGASAPGVLSEGVEFGLEIAKEAKRRTHSKSFWEVAVLIILGDKSSFSCVSNAVHMSARMKLSDSPLLGPSLDLLGLIQVVDFVKDVKIKEPALLWSTQSLWNLLLRWWTPQQWRGGAGWSLPQGQIKQLDIWGNAGTWRCQKSKWLMLQRLAFATHFSLKAVSHWSCRLLVRLQPMDF